MKCRRGTGYTIAVPRHARDDPWAAFDQSRLTVERA